LNSDFYHFFNEFLLIHKINNTFFIDFIQLLNDTNRAITLFTFFCVFSGMEVCMATLEKTGADSLIDVLVQEKVEYIFGLPGGAAIPLFDALVGSSLKFVLTRHEQSAVHMADGYARATGKVGVALVTSGPGATNTITGLFTALMDSVPIVVISGQAVTWSLGLDAFQEADVSGLTYSAVKHSFLIKEVNDIPRIVQEAFYLARTGRPGPVLIDIPKDISSKVFVPNYEANFQLPGYNPAHDPDPSQIQRAAQLLKKARKPLLLLGHGSIISGAEDEIRQIVEMLSIPVINTLLGKGAFPESHELNLGMLGMHGTAYANKAVVEADLIFSIGSRWDDRIVGNYEDFAKGAVKIHIDIDPAELNKVVQVDCALQGDAKQVLHALIPHLERTDLSAWLRQVKRWKKEFPLTYRKEGKLRAQHVIEELYKLTKGKAVVTTDVGQHQMWAAQFFLTDQRFNWLSSGGAGTMGWGFPAAIGAQLGRPGEIVIAIVGDGGFQMTLPELSTAMIQKLPLKIVVINNRYLGMVRQWQNLFYDDRLSGVDLDGNPDFVKLAQAYGMKAFRIRRSADVKKVLKAALAYNDGPCLIDAEVEKHDNVFPMIPAGASLRDMILEPPKKKMEKPVGST
jgi:acetolactate synthase-1/2/3 large subunit